MTIKELDEYLFINSNQYFLGHENIEVKPKVLQGIVKRALMYFGNARPKIWRKYNFNILSEKTIITEVDGRFVVDIHEIYLTDPVYFETPVTFKWNFDNRNNFLWSMFTGTYNIDFIVKPTLEDINYNDQEFLDMCLGLYLMYVGEARKAFNLSELPFENDGSDLYSDGKELFENTKESLQEENSSWYLAIK